MAIVKAKYTRSRVEASAYVRYFMHRKGKDGREGNRALFNADGALTEEQAYRLIEGAGKGTNFFKMIINFDPKREDTRKDLSLSEITVQTMLALQERLGREVRFVAAQHDDHTNLRHVHLLALVRAKLAREDLQALREVATQTARFQRQERDLAPGREAPQRSPGRAPGPRSRAPSRRGRGERQVRPARIRPSCPSCGAGHEMQKLSEQRYRCPGCSLVVRSSGGLSLAIEGEGLELEY